ncbi:Type I restriction modification DNA specificity domain protein [Rhodospirillaceae bacterium LM-1]|nr:Type I restriction modification DNA specificity domain protein [Rhodospirillaceae bacterium LM-1]
MITAIGACGLPRRRRHDQRPFDSSFPCRWHAQGSRGMTYPRYPKYKDSGVEWLGEVPEHWNVASVKRLFSVVGGSTPKSENEAFWEGGIVWVTPADLSQIKGLLIADSTRRISEEGLASCGTTLVPEGSLILSTRAPIGSLGIAATVMCTNQGCKALVPNPETNAKFYAYLFSASNDELNIRGKGTTFLELSGDALASFSIPVPFPVEQTAIAVFLDRETGRIDALIAEQEKLIELLKEKRQAVISHAVTKGLDPSAPMKDSGIKWLGDVPAHWEFKRFKDVCVEIVDCKNRTPDQFDDGEYFVVRTSCVKDGLFDQQHGYMTNLDNFLEWTRKGRPRDGDVLFTREAPAGEACLSPVGLDFCLGQRMMYLRPDLSQIRSDFLLLSVYGPQVRQFIQAKAKGSTVGHLRVGEVGELPCLIPPIDEQAALSATMAQFDCQMDELSAEALRAIELLKEHRSALISAAVTGKIDVRGLVPDQEAA